MEHVITPQEYFDEVKGRKHKVTDQKLLDVYDNCLELLNKYMMTGQKKAAKKLLFHLDCIEKERGIVARGIDTFVYRDDIEYYIDEVAEKVVKIQDVESYEREIPDEIAKLIEEFRNVFDGMYIVFTDYTGKVEKQIEKERREKDPILFGTFEDKTSRSVCDRMYYLGDWVDEYCNLTLDKMVNETARLGKRDIERKIKTPEDIKELREQLNGLVPAGDTYRAENKPKKSFFKNIKSAVKKK